VKARKHFQRLNYTLF
jgi:hypothetical protein